MDFAYVHVLVKLAYVHVHWYVCVCVHVYFTTFLRHIEIVFTFLLLLKSVMFRVAMD